MEWLGACWHQALTWTNFDLSSKVSGGIHMRTISHEVLNMNIIDLFRDYTFEIN